jgi:DnaJ like chaperone protein
MQLFMEQQKFDAEWVILLMILFFKIAHADGTPNARTRKALEKICDEVGGGYEAFAKLYEQTQSNPRRPAKSVGDAYTVLGCQPTDAPHIIKERYRKLVKDFHPDTIMSKGLPAEFIRFAEDRFKQIQAAYETVMEARGAAGKV